MSSSRKTNTADGRPSRSATGKKSKIKQKPLPALIKKLDTVFSRYVRMSAADNCGTVECVTCGKPMHWKEAHAGHFISRRHMSVRWVEKNVHPQCCGCNTFKGGALDEYSAFIIRKYGMKVFDDLRLMKNSTKKWTRDELTEMIARYESMLKGMSLDFLA
jgi:Bacteriophage Lambda NinG protein